MGNEITHKEQPQKYRNFTFYSDENGNIQFRAFIEDESIWVTQKDMGSIFDTSRENITLHLKTIFNASELDIEAVCKKFLHTASDGKKYMTNFYNLDAIIAVGYRVNSYKATRFRIWATKVLKEYLVKGFALDDERLKQSKTLFGTDYFEELLERIREIRASERRFYQKITDIYQQCSCDYDPHSPITRNFFAHAQNKLEYAVVGMTAAEIIKARADHSLSNMNLNTWSQQGKGGKITRKDVTVAKNYLREEEISELNRLVNMFLDYAENLAKKKKPMAMQDWSVKLDTFLEFNEYEVLSNFGKVEKQVADDLALAEFEKFRPVQDENYESDFDRVVEKCRKTKLKGKN